MKSSHFCRNVQCSLLCANGRMRMLLERSKKEKNGKRLTCTTLATDKCSEPSPRFSHKRHGKLCFAFKFQSKNTAQYNTGGRTWFPENHSSSDLKKLMQFELFHFLSLSVFYRFYFFFPNCKPLFAFTWTVQLTQCCSALSKWKVIDSNWSSIMCTEAKS